MRFLLMLSLVGTALCAIAQPAERVEATWGLDVLRPILRDQRNIVLPLAGCELDGFVLDRRAEHRVPILARTATPARVTAAAPRADAYYPAVVIYDGAGEERLAIAIDGVEKGVAVADFDDNRERLFFLTDPYVFRGGEKMELRALGTAGKYRIENILLLKEKPAARRRAHEIAGVQAQASADSATITWITASPMAGVLEWGPEGGAVAERVPQRNHRVVLRGVRTGRRYHFRIVSQEAATEWQSFETRAPAAARGALMRTRVPLRVPAAGPKFPVTSGLPFPKGALASDREMRLLDARGREAPLQTATLARWEDGSVKWALLDFQAEGGRYMLECGSAVARKPSASPLRVTESAEVIEVATGPLRFRVSRRSFGLMESLWVRQYRMMPAGRTAAFYLTAPDGAVYSSLGPPDELVVEEDGPLRAVIRASGEHRGADGRKLFAYVVRLHAYAGQPWVRVQYTLGNNSGSAQFANLRRLDLKIPLAAAGAVRVSEPRVTYSDRERPQGWAEWSDGAHRATLSVRDFWQNYPKTLKAGAEGFEVGICPPLRPDQYADAAGTVDAHRLFYYLRDGLYSFHQGMTKTHEFRLDFGAAAERERTAPLAALAPPGWYAGSHALGELAEPENTGLLGEYDAAFARGFAEYLNNREKNREFGMLNFGDWWGERFINWGNSEYDTQHALFLQFLRTGNPAYFSAGEQVEWHNRDVDTIHYSPVPTRIGGVYYHSVGHTGRWFPESPVKGQGINVGDTIVDHTFIEGHLDYYYLTGDRRSLETARNTADRYCGNYTRNYDFEVVRQPGWHLILSMAMYGATNDRYYLNAARIIVERVLERQTAAGQWELQDARECPGSPPHNGQQTFMLGVLLTGLKNYHAVTGDPRVAESIVKGARFTIDHAWSDQAHAFRNTSCTAAPPGYGSSFLIFEGIAYAHRLTGDERFRDVLVSGTGPAVAGLRGMGKSFTQYTRSTPHFIGYAARLQGK